MKWCRIKQLMWYCWINCKKKKTSKQCQHDVSACISFYDSPGSHRKDWHASERLSYSLTQIAIMILVEHQSTYKSDVIAQCVGAFVHIIYTYCTHQPQALFFGVYILWCTKSPWQDRLKSSHQKKSPKLRGINACQEENDKYPLVKYQHYSRYRPCNNITMVSVSP